MSRDPMATITDAALLADIPVQRRDRCLWHGSKAAKVQIRAGLVPEGLCKVVHPHPGGLADEVLVAAYDAEQEQFTGSIRVDRSSLLRVGTPDKDIWLEVLHSLPQTQPEPAPARKPRRPPVETWGPPEWIIGGEVIYGVPGEPDPRGVVEVLDARPPGRPTVVRIRLPNGEIELARLPGGRWRPKFGATDYDLVPLPRTAAAR